MSVVTDRHLDDPRVAQSYNFATGTYETWALGVDRIARIVQTNATEKATAHIPHMRRILRAAGH